ncbi:MAG: hypothetical protein PHE68_04990 [Candidatus Peribacteraceae bacterium]|nr:hypothetical protein [Candidatus Peribacteraceae bacterium]MDD5075028.1 hypothetical protein [Candidatus Peribacteraceae bacterium]
MESRRSGTQAWAPTLERTLEGKDGAWKGTDKVLFHEILEYNPHQVVYTPTMSKVFFAGILILCLAGLGAADAFFVEKGLPVSTATPPSTSSVPAVAGSSSMAASGTIVGGVKKKTGADVLETVSSHGFTFENTDERTLIAGVVQNKESVQTRVLLKDGDRAGLLSWIETPLVKEYFSTLKESLHPLFSPEIKDLLDEIQRNPGKPPRNFLTFLDPGISEERLVFVRVRDRLFEFHIATGKEEAMYQLVETLTN